MTIFGMRPNESFQVRKAKTRDGRNAVTYELVAGSDGKPWVVPCRFERLGRRVVTNEGAEFATDGTFFFTVTDAPEILEDDILLTSTGETFRVSRIRSAHVPFSFKSYAQVDAVRTRQTVPS